MFSISRESHTSAASWRIEMPAFKVASRPPREFTPEQLERTHYLANVVTNYQRAHDKLAEEIQKKRASHLGDVTTASPMSPTGFRTAKTRVALTATSTVDSTTHASIPPASFSIVKTVPLSVPISQQSAKIVDPLLTHIEARKQRAVPPVSTPHDGEEPLPSVEEGNENQTLSPLEEGQKRKYSHEDDDQLEWHEINPQTNLKNAYNETRAQREATFRCNRIMTCSCGMAHKISRSWTLAKVRKEIEIQVFDLVKGRFARDIFRSSRESWMRC
ncbi:hypothetical protein EJ02DRAFT_476649 [Clathrospora elynae]|uniref:Uncharacterized protein n=1 Tax=Clathrospora elynae TaxID=706981 RepID=A0A6A5SCV0_9PLEO|nr:hypothetical protein EJ02DRAFT_476649 [Clathrospora elynae]